MPSASSAGASQIFNPNLTKSDPDFVLSVNNLHQTLADKSLYENNMYFSTQQNGPKNLASNNPFMYNSTADDLTNVDGTSNAASDSKTVIGPGDAIKSESVDDASHADATADLHVIAHVSNLVSVQIDHYQYLFLLRLSEEMTELATFLSLDSNRILQKVCPIAAHHLFGLSILSYSNLQTNQLSSVV